jgi:peptide/nickel transport system permease protein
MTADTDTRVSSWRLLLGNPVTVVSGAILIVIAVVALTADWIAPFGVNDVNVPDALQGPSGAHWFGTDELGRDVFSRVLVATQASLRVAVISVAFAVVVGVTIGVVSGYRGGWLDTIFMRVVDVMFAFPVLLLALAVVAILGPGLTTTILAIGIVYTPIFARVARAPALALKAREFVEAARTFGSTQRYILTRHLLLNLIAPLTVTITLALAWSLLTESGLSFLGLGSQPPAPSLGVMLAESKSMMTRSPWLMLFPGLTIMLAILGFNLLGDALRDILDPRTQGRSA